MELMRRVLCGVCPVVHQEDIEVADVVDEERLVAGWHKMPSPLVGAVTDLSYEPSAQSQ